MVYRLLFICRVHSNPQALMLEIEAHLAFFPVGLLLSSVTNEAVTRTEHSHVKMYLWGARSPTDPRNLVVHQLMILLLRVPVVSIMGLCCSSSIIGCLVRRRPGLASSTPLPSSSRLGGFC